jgi:acetyl esterase/lipase
MKALKVIIIIIIFSANLMQHSTAQIESGQKRGRLKAFLQQRRTQKELQTESGLITIKLDVAYTANPDRLQKLDIYFPPEKENPVPVLVHFHGGGWKMGDKKETKNHGIFYATHGILFISVNYRLSPVVQHPAHIEDCAVAISWVLDNIHDLGGDENRIFISGHSAGAHLAALLATNPTYNFIASKLAGVISVDMASFNLLSPGNERLVKNFIREAFGTNPEILKSASPFYNIFDNKVYPKFLIFNTNERESAVEQSNNFVNKLRNTGGNVQFIVVDSHTHRDMNLAMYNESDPVGSAILKFILKR